MACNHGPQGCVVSHRIASDRTEQWCRFLENIAGACFRIYILELLIVCTAEKGEWRRQRSGTHAGHHVKIRSVAPVAPADQKSGAESAIISATRNCEKMSCCRGTPREISPLTCLHSDIENAVRISHIKSGIGNV